MIAATAQVMPLPINAGETWHDTDPDKAATTLSTSNKTLDGLLEYGLQYGSLSCISAEVNEDSMLIGNMLIASHLRGSKGATVTIIDAANTFDVRALSREVQRRPSSASGHDSTDMLAMLERVNIIRTFDIQGIRESLDKIRANLASGQLEKEHLLVVHRCSQSAGILLKNNEVQGLAFLEAFFRSMKALSVEYDVCSVLLDGFVQSRDVDTNQDCLLEPSDMQPFFNMATAPGLDLHLHVHVAGPREQTEHRILEIASSRSDARSRRWTHCTVSGLKN